MLTDTHAHLMLPEFDDDRDAVIQRARDAGVERIVVIGIDVETSRAAIDLAARYDGIYATVGIHPNEVERASTEDVAQIEALAGLPGVVGIGETGLDFYRDHVSPERQNSVFRWHIQLARRCNLPVVVHDRDAHDEVLSTLQEEKAADTGVALHCFTGDQAMAAKAVAAGYHISFGGLVTFRKTALDTVIPHIPLDRLLVETDAPYLAPVPFRGRRNEPAHLVHTASAVARFRGMTPEAVAELTSRNAQTLFRLP